MIDISKYDFIDFGSSKGGCIDFALKKLGGRCPLGVEINKKKLKNLTKKGYACIYGDVLNLANELPKKSIRFVTMSHFLEHLNSINEVEKVIKIAADLATEFIFIQGPSFDFDQYLKSLGLKFFWADWTGHKTKVTINNLTTICEKLQLPSYNLLIEVPYVTDSSSPDIHPLNSPKDQFEYKKRTHPKKKIKTFDIKIHRSFIFYVWLQHTFQREQLLTVSPKYKLVHP
jgi:hypothetical protein